MTKQRKDNKALEHRLNTKIKTKQEALSLSWATLLGDATNDIHPSIGVVEKWGIRLENNGYGDTNRNMLRIDLV